MSKKNTKLKTLGERLRAARLKKCSHCGSEGGFTLRYVAANSGVSNAYISQLEHDKIKVPSPKILAALADFYKIPYTSLMKAAGYRV